MVIGLNICKDKVELRFNTIYRSTLLKRTEHFIKFISGNVNILEI
jgi:hypothetical protein